MLNGVRAASAVLCIAMVMMWIRSQFAGDLFFRQIVTPTMFSDRTFISTSGRLNISGFNIERKLALPHGVKGSIPSDFGWIYRATPPSLRKLPDFEWTTTRMILANGEVKVEWNIAFPYWLVALISSILPGTWLVARARVWRTPTPGLCQTCGYDLRATPDRCPECGTIPAETESPKALA